MKRFLTLLSTLALVACDQPEVVVQAVLPPQGEATDSVLLADLPVRLLPYDRDAIFDSLEAAAAEPEPEIPPEILEQQRAVQAAQTAWREAEERWGVVRDSLRSLSERLEQMRQQGLRATPQYRQLFERFGTLDAEEDRVNQAMRVAFERFTSLQQATLTRADSIRVVRETWAERAFADFPQIVAARLEQMDLEELADTTGATGLARFRVPEEGRWWVYARYTLPYEELYWNIPIEVPGDTLVRLTPENAERRPVM